MSKYTKKELNNALRVVQLKLKLGMIGKGIAKFDMSTGYNEYCSADHSCGSVGCIGGYAEHELGITPHTLLGDVEKDKTPILYRLFYPDGYGKGEEDDWSRKLTPSKAIQAIENYLKGKKDPWAGVVKNNTNREYLRNIKEMENN